MAVAEVELNDDVDVLLERTDALTQQQEYDRALEYLERALGAVGEDPRLLERYNDLAVYLKHHELALDSARRLEEAAERVSPWNQLKIAEALLHLNRPEEALLHIEAAVYERGFKRSAVFDLGVYDLLRDDERFRRCVQAAHDSIGLGSPIPDLTVRSLDGREIALGSLAGKVVLVDFWATWCRPCVRELPNLKALYDEHAAQGFEIVGLSLDESRQTVEKYLVEQGVPWPVSHLDRGWKSTIVTEYGVNALPSLWVYDRGGVLRYYNVTGEELREAVEALL